MLEEAGSCFIEEVEDSRESKDSELSTTIDAVKYQ